jgi:carbamoyl-phosphate synthase large subunit
VGCSVVATAGTAKVLADAGVKVESVVGKLSERGAKTLDAVQLIERGEIAFVINTPQASGTHSDGEAIRKAANVKGVALVTTVRAARAAVQGMRERRETPLGIRSLQEYHGKSS